jgi:hypothetical protein
MTQWHLLGEDEHAATKFIHDCAAWCSKIRDAILVFDQSQWRPDHGLWESVQKVSMAGVCPIYSPLAMCTGGSVVAEPCRPRGTT